jgi:hypothetical protein
MALLGESTESSQVCSKFRLSPAMVRTSRLAARLFALLTLTKWKKVYNKERYSYTLHSQFGSLIYSHACKFL